MATIMINIADHAWTKEAVHQACKMAWQGIDQIVLVQMLPVEHMRWVGYQTVSDSVSQDDFDHLQEYADTAEDYGVAMSLKPMQYFDLPDAIMQMADELEAVTVFAKLPPSRFGFWRQHQLRGLERGLAARSRLLYTLEDESHTPAQAMPQLVTHSAGR